MDWRTSALCGVSTLVLSGLLQPAWAQSTQAGAGASTVREIIVTAQKREESINSVAMSVQAATGDQLTRMGISDTSQLAKIAPGFSFTPSAYGTPVFSIRGVGFQDTSLAASPTVSVYVDEAPLPFSIMASGATLDLERVEVLKGPQGTLFGENATGGAINYVANKPTNTFQAGMDASYGRFNAVDLQGFVSGPISDTVSVRAALRTQQSGPWQKSYTRNDQLGAQNFTSGRFVAQWKPTPEFRALLTLSGFQDKSETQAAQFFGVSALNANATVPAGLVNYPLAPHNDRAADWSPCVNIDGVETNSGIVGLPHEPRFCSGYRKDNTFYSASLRLGYDLPNDMTVTSLSSYERFDRNQPIDGDGTTFRNYESLQRGHAKVTYQELRLSGKIGDEGNFIIGGNYEYDDTWDNFLQSYPQSSSGTVFGRYLGPTRPLNRQKTTTYAVFTNVEVPVTDTISLQGGARYTKQLRHFYGCASDAGDGSFALTVQGFQNLLITGNPFAGPGINVGPGNCATMGPPPTFTPGPVLDNLTEDNLSWRAGVNWKAVPGTLVYFNVSKGYKSGSFPTGSTSSYAQLKPATQESVLAYEGGFKSRMLDGTLQLNAAAFYYDYTDKQILGAIRDPVFGALPALVNVPKSHVIGFEVNGAWRAMRRLTISPAVSYAKSKIDGDFVNFNYIGVEQNFGGESFPLAPSWQGNLDVQYEWPLQGEMTAFVGANLNYQSKTNSFFGRVPLLEVPSYALLDLRAGIEQGDWRLEVWGRNVTDKWYWTAAYHVNDVFVRYTGRPATYGATVTYRFH